MVRKLKLQDQCRYIRIHLDYIEKYINDDVVIKNEKLSQLMLIMNKKCVDGMKFVWNGKMIQKVRY